MAESRLSQIQWESQSIRKMYEIWNKRRDELDNFEINENALREGYRTYKNLISNKQRKGLIETRPRLFLELGKLKYYSIIEGFEYDDNISNLDKNIALLEARKKGQIIKQDIIVSSGILESKQETISIIQRDIISSDAPGKEEVKYVSIKKYKKLKRKVKNLLHQFNQIKNTKEIDDSALVELREEYQKLSIDHKLTKEEYDSTNIIYDDLLSFYRQNHASLFDKYQKLEDKNKEKDEEIIKLGKELRDVNREVIYTEGQMDILRKEFRDQIDALRIETERQRQEESERQREEIERKLREKDQELQELKKKYETLELTFRQSVTGNNKPSTELN